MSRLTFALLAASVVWGQSGPPLVLKQSVPLPGVSGRIDHLAVDLASHRLFVAALGNNTVEVIDWNAGRRLHTISGLQEPQGILYLADVNRIYVAGGGDGACRIYDGTSYRLLRTVAFGGGCR